MTRDILDQIDHVLADYGTSSDAMRWTPEPQPEVTPQVALGGENITGRTRTITSPGFLWRVYGQPYVERASRGPYEAADGGHLYFHGSHTTSIADTLWPRGEVAPLAIDGAKYQRRQKARRKRR